MLFAIIFVISFLLVFYIYNNINYKKYSKNQRVKLESPKLLLGISSLFIICISSIIYYKIGSPFIDMNELNSSKLKLIESKNQKDIVFNQDLKKLNELLLKSKVDPSNLNVLLNLASTASRLNKNDLEISSLNKILSIKNTPKLKSLLAQAIVRKAGGQVTSKAQKLINEALIGNPLDPGANFLYGLAQSQMETKKKL